MPYIVANTDTVLKQKILPAQDLIDQYPDSFDAISSGSELGVVSISDPKEGHRWVKFDDALCGRKGGWIYPGHFDIPEGIPSPPSPTPSTSYNQKLINDPGLVGPKKLPGDFEFGPNDSHLIVNDRDEWCRAYDFNGKLLWEVPALARGQGGDFDWLSNGSDTPPGIYKAGAIYRDYDKAGPNASYSRDLMSYGWYSVDLVDLENQETGIGRAGIMVHGGGSGNGWPGAWNAKQRLLPTLGCVRLYNVVMRDRVIPLCDKGIVYFSVYQEAKKR